MYKVYIHIPDKDCPVFEFDSMELAERFCISVTLAKDVKSASICKNRFILMTYAKGNILG